VTTLESFSEALEGVPPETLNIIGVYPGRVVKDVRKCFDLRIGVTDAEIKEEFERRILLQKSIKKSN
jgi:hypothetical protein